LRIWGLNAFDPSQGNLLLPRLEWRRCGGKATLRLTLFSESSLQHDAIQAKEFIAQMRKSACSGCWRRKRCAWSNDV
ncbi:hypothetical protein ACUOFC_66470, partial [Escherichia sp. TWPC-MK]